MIDNSFVQRQKIWLWRTSRTMTVLTTMRMGRWRPKPLNESWSQQLRCDSNIESDVECKYLTSIYLSIHLSNIFLPVFLFPCLFSCTAMISNQSSVISRTGWRSSHCIKAGQTLKTTRRTKRRDWWENTRYHGWRGVFCIYVWLFT